MNHERLDTGQALAAGVLSRKKPEPGIPEGRQGVSVYTYDNLTVELVTRLLNEDKVVDCPEYYGIPIAWREGTECYYGKLLQYREITEDCVFSTSSEAAAWFVSRAYAVAG